MSQAHAYRFGPWRLVPAEHQLLRGETPVTLTPKAFETLCVLVERHGHLVTTQALLEAVWRQVAASRERTAAPRSAP